MPKRILSIDDSRMVHLVVAKALKPLDVEVLTAVNGQEGLEKAEQEMPDLILLDVSMPVMDGIEALAALKANAATRDIPVVILSADAGQDEQDKRGAVIVVDHRVHDEGHKNQPQHRELVWRTTKLPDHNLMYLE